ncbi:MAG: type III pantothenate kinase [Gammaproteobacteria bacterium]
MNLLLDIGNSRIKWALQRDEGLEVKEPLLRNDKAFKDIARPAWKDLESPVRVIISSVAGETFDKSIRTWIKRRWKMYPDFLRSESDCCGVSNAYQEPEYLGSDRWAALIATHSLYHSPAIIIDCGTALTIDAIDAEGQHKGGLIIPGLDMMVNALKTGAADLSSDVNTVDEISLLARDTVSAIKAGTLYTMAAAIDTICQDLSYEMGDQTVAVLTGGDIQRVLPLLACEPKIHDDLVLQGIAIFADQTKSVDTADSDVSATTV